jgi:allantoicase
MTERFLELIDLASERLGASVVAANDEFFGAKDRLISLAPPIWVEDRYTEHGKWMDGWETRRRREPGHDWSIVRLGLRGMVRGLDVETTHFKGNAPEACAVDVCDPAGRALAADQSWTEVLPHSPLKADAHNRFAVAGSALAAYIRLRIFPDGGIARLRVYGEVAVEWPRIRRRGQIDLAAVEHGGLIVGCSDMFFGSPQNLILPGDAYGMRDGWETRRRRDGGHDWVVVRLGTSGMIARAEVDTRFFKGNAPAACSLEAAVSAEASAPLSQLNWRDLLPQSRLEPDTRHQFEDELVQMPAVSYVRLNIFPDGGVARLRLFGNPV